MSLYVEHVEKVLRSVKFLNHLNRCFEIMFIYIHLHHASSAVCDSEGMVALWKKTFLGLSRTTPGGTHVGRREWSVISAWLRSKCTCEDSTLMFATSSDCSKLKSLKSIGAPESSSGS